MHEEEFHDNLDLTTAATSNNVQSKRDETLFDMRVKIRSQEKCPICNSAFKTSPSGLTCPQHPKVRPQHYYLDWYFMGEQYKLFGFDSLKVAFQKAAAIEEEIDGHKFKPQNYKNQNKSFNKKFRFDVVWDSWILTREQDMKREIISPGYFKQLKRRTALFKNFFKNEDVRTIEKYRINEFKNSLPVTCSLKTISSHLEILRKFFNDLYEEDRIAEPVRFPKIKVQRPVIKWLTKEQQEQVFKHIPDRHKPIFIFLFNTGCRPGEARALLWSDIDFEKGIITIQHSFSDNVHRKMTKGKKSRIIPMSTELQELLKKHPRTLRNNFVFNTYYGKPYGLNRLRKIWAEACTLAGIEGVTCYGGTRHSFASQAVNRNVSLAIIGEWLGHSDKTTTDKYAHVNLEGMKTVFEN
jgi:integrase